MAAMQFAEALTQIEKKGRPGLTLVMEDLVESAKGMSRDERAQLIDAIKSALAQDRQLMTGFVDYVFWILETLIQADVDPAVGERHVAPPRGRIWA